MAESDTAKHRFARITKTAGPILILGTIYFAWSYAARNRRQPKPQARRLVRSRSKTIGTLHGGQLALQRLIDHNAAKANPATLDNAETIFKALLEEEHLDFQKLQTYVAKLEMSSKEDAAVDALTEAVEKAKEEDKFHEAYELEMLLLEMLIYKGDFRKALDCDCLKHEELTDARRPLYQAILNLMTDKPKEAEKCWNEYDYARSQYIPPSKREKWSQDGLTNFTEFEKKVNLLKEDIKKQLAATKCTPKK